MSWSNHCNCGVHKPTYINKSQKRYRPVTNSRFISESVALQVRHGTPIIGKAGTRANHLPIRTQPRGAVPESRRNSRRKFHGAQHETIT